jgi:hypothetical protein
MLLDEVVEKRKRGGIVDECVGETRIAVEKIDDLAVFATAVVANERRVMLKAPCDVGGASASCLRGVRRADGEDIEDAHREALGDVPRWVLIEEEPSDNWLPLSSFCQTFFESRALMTASSANR